MLSDKRKPELDPLFHMFIERKGFKSMPIERPPTLCANIRRFSNSRAASCHRHMTILRKAFAKLRAAV